MHRLFGLLTEMAVEGSLRFTVCKKRPINLESLDETFSSEVVVLPKICSSLPNVTLDSSKSEAISNLKLADPR